MDSTEEAGLDIDFDAELAHIQGVVAGTAPPDEPGAGNGDSTVSGTVMDARRTIEFLDRKFRIADKIGLMPLLKFSAYSDVATSDPRALGAMYAMLRDCIYGGEPACGTCAQCKAGDETACPSWAPGDWRAFEDHAIETKADAEDLLDVITDVIELISGRPTEPPGTSSPGRRAISRGSTARSSGRQGRARGSRR